MKEEGQWIQSIRVSILLQLELSAEEDPELTVQETAERGCCLEGSQWVTEKFGNITSKHLCNFLEDIAEKRSVQQKKENKSSPPLKILWPMEISGEECTFER